MASCEILHILHLRFSSKPTTSTSYIYSLSTASHDWVRCFRIVVKAIVRIVSFVIYILPYHRLCLTNIYLDPGCWARMRVDEGLGQGIFNSKSRIEERKRTDERIRSFDGEVPVEEKVTTGLEKISNDMPHQLPLLSCTYVFPVVGGGKWSIFSTTSRRWRTYHIFGAQIH